MNSSVLESINDVCASFLRAIGYSDDNKMQECKKSFTQEIYKNQEKELKRERFADNPTGKGISVQWWSRDTCSDFGNKIRISITEEFSKEIDNPYNDVLDLNYRRTYAFPIMYSRLIDCHSQVIEHLKNDSNIDSFELNKDANTITVNFNRKKVFQQAKARGLYNDTSMEELEKEYQKSKKKFNGINIQVRYN